MKPRLPGYGLDAPKLVRSFLIAGLLLLAMTLGLAQFATNWLTALASIAFTFGLVFTIEGLLMIWSRRYGKTRARDRLLDRLGLTARQSYWMLAVAPDPR